MYLYKGTNVISKKISKKNNHCSLIKVHLFFRWEPLILFLQIDNNNKIFNNSAFIKSQSYLKENSPL